MITLLSNVAIQDTSNLSNIVYLNNIMEGVDGSSTFGYSLEPSAVKVDDNQTQQYLHDHTFDIRVLQGAAADLTKLKVIDANQTPVLVSGYSPDGFFVIDDPASLTYHSQYDSVIADRVLVTTSGVNGYGGAAPGNKLPVYAGDNLLAIFNVLEGSASALNGLDYSATGTVTGDAMAITGAGTVLSQRIFFPFPGLNLFTSADITVGTNGFIGFNAYDATDTIIGSGIVSAWAGTGYKTSTFSTNVPSGTVYIRFRLQGLASFTFRNPSIRLQGSSFSL